MGQQPFSIYSDGLDSTVPPKAQKIPHLLSWCSPRLIPLPLLTLCNSCPSASNSLQGKALSASSPPTPTCSNMRRYRILGSLLGFCLLLKIGRGRMRTFENTLRGKKEQLKLMSSLGTEVRSATITQLMQPSSPMHHGTHLLPVTLRE